MTKGAENLTGSRMNDLGLIRIEEPPTEKLLRHLIFTFGLKWTS